MPGPDDSTKSAGDSGDQTNYSASTASIELAYVFTESRLNGYAAVEILGGVWEEAENVSISTLFMAYKYQKAMICDIVRFVWFLGIDGRFRQLSKFSIIIIYR